MMKTLNDLDATADPVAAYKLSTAQWLTVTEVCDLTRQSKTVVLAQLRRGEYPGAKKGGIGGKTSKWLIPADDVINFGASRAA